MTKKLPLIILFILTLCGCFDTLAQQSVSSAKRERNFIKEGNTLYEQKRYAEAEIAYRKAIQENSASETAKFNLAAALLHQVSLASGQEEQSNNTRNEARALLQELATNAQNNKIAENSFYNLGNMSFNEQQYGQSIDLYKRALRKNPDNDKARENLRLAQLKLEEQQNQDQNQDQQQDKNQDNQNQNQQQQDQQQNEDQQDQNNEKDQQPQQQQQDQQQQQQEQAGISDRNAEQILKAMENQENATRKKIEAEKAKEEQSRTRYNTDKPW